MLDSWLVLRDGQLPVLDKGLNASLCVCASHAVNSCSVKLKALKEQLRNHQLLVFGNFP
jgi:hypothetical protein